MSLEESPEEQDFSKSLLPASLQFYVAIKGLAMFTVQLAMTSRKLHAVEERPFKGSVRGGRMIGALAPVVVVFASRTHTDQDQ